MIPQAKVMDAVDEAVAVMDSQVTHWHDFAVRSVALGLHDQARYHEGLSKGFAQSAGIIRAKLGLVR